MEAVYLILIPAIYFIALGAYQVFQDHLDMKNLFYEAELRKTESYVNPARRNGLSDRANELLLNNPTYE